MALRSTLLPPTGAASHPISPPLRETCSLRSVPVKELQDDLWSGGPVKGSITAQKVLQADELGSICPGRTRNSQHFALLQVFYYTLVTFVQLE